MWGESGMCLEPAPKKEVLGIGEERLGDDGREWDEKTVNDGVLFIHLILVFG